MVLSWEILNHNWWTMKPPILFLLLLCLAGPATAQSTEPVPPAEWLPDYAGRLLRFASPTEGQSVVAGDSITIALDIEQGDELEFAMIVLPGQTMVLTPPFSSVFGIDASALGPLTFSALGKTSAGGMVTSHDVTIEIVAGDDALLDLVAGQHDGVIGGIGCTQSLWILGRYESGIKRDLPAQHVAYSVIRGPDVVCVTATGIVVGRQLGEAVVRAAYGGRDLDLAFKVVAGTCDNNAPQANLPPLLAGRPGSELCLDASMVWDLDTCLGEELDPGRIHWKVEQGGEVLEGNGFTFCFTPREAELGLVTLEVTDAHGASSWTMAVLEIEDGEETR